MSSKADNRADARATCWWVHGAAPGGGVFFHAAQAAADRSITTNAGLFDFLGAADRFCRPDEYWLQDPAAVELFGRFAHVARALGTRIITGAAEGEPPHGADLRLPLAAPHDDPPVYREGRVLEHLTLSGLLSLQWVLYRAKPCDTVILTGMTGYASSPAGVAIDELDGRTGKPKGAAHNARTAAYLQSAIETRRGVRFVFAGKPHRVLTPAWAVAQPNLVIVRDAAALTAAIRQVPQPQPAA